MERGGTLGVQRGEGLGLNKRTRALRAITIPAAQRVTFPRNFNAVSVEVMTTGVQVGEDNENGVVDHDQKTRLCEFVEFTRHDFFSSTWYGV